jgi:hypothetical protein
LVFYKGTIIPMVLWSYERTGFWLNLDTILKTLTVDPMPVFERLDVPELSFGEAFTYSEQLDPRPLQGLQQPFWWSIPGPAEFAISLIVYVDATNGKCPLCDHEEQEKPSDNEKGNNG